MCYPNGDFRVGPQDVFLGEVADCPFYIGAAQFDYWRHTQLIIDVVPGRGGGFSLEAPEGVRFLTRSRVFTDDEAHETGRSRRASARGLAARLLKADPSSIARGRLRTDEGANRTSTGASRMLAAILR